MLADFFTKPLQGSLLRKLRAVIMGHAHISTLSNTPSATVQERVGNDNLGQTKIVDDHSKERLSIVRKLENVLVVRGTKRSVRFE